MRIAWLLVLGSAQFAVPAGAEFLPDGPSLAPPPLLDATLHIASKAGGIAPLAKHAGSVLTTAADPDTVRRWRFRAEYFQGSPSDWGFIFTRGDIETIPQNGAIIGLGYLLARDFCKLPLDLFLQGTVMYHNEKDVQENFFQYTASLRADWKHFPWNHHLRTKIGLASGWSYVEKIPVAEVLNRGSPTSRHLLHYLEASIFLNSGDLFRLVGLNQAFAVFDSTALDHIWLTGRILHRSGAWGFYGEDNNGNDLRDASNFLAIGLEWEF